jgi:hypothetical protein
MLVIFGSVIAEMQVRMHLARVGHAGSVTLAGGPATHSWCGFAWTAHRQRREPATYPSSYLRWYKGNYETSRCAYAPMSCDRPKGRATSDVKLLTIIERVDPKPLGVEELLALAAVLADGLAALGNPADGQLEWEGDERVGWYFQ